MTQYDFSSITTLGTPLIMERTRDEEEVENK